MSCEGAYALVHYTGSFDNGEVFDSSLDRDPLEFQVGTGAVIRGFDKAVQDMKLDEERSIILPPEEAYGSYDETLVYSFPIEDVKSQFDPQLGMTIGVQLDDGTHASALITGITDTEVKLDMNHPLAGKTLHFTIKLIEINDEPKYSDECGSGECGDSCGGGCSCC